jgi:hypothetical protein
VADGVASVRIRPRRPEPSLYAERTFLFFTFDSRRGCRHGAFRWSASYRGAAPPKSLKPRVFRPGCATGSRISACRSTRAGCNCRWCRTRRACAIPQQAPFQLLVKYRDKTSVTERIRQLLRSHLREECPADEVGRVLA